jgi:hypothetical protein
MDKVIHELTATETEDGFRIEIKGNNEAIRRMLWSCGPSVSSVPTPFLRGFRFDCGPGIGMGSGVVGFMGRDWQACKPH